jgi:hypothetical protein
MRFNYKQYPILKKLKEGKLGDVPVYEIDNLFALVESERFVRNWKYACRDFSQQINVIATPFWEAAEKAKIKLIELYKDIMVNDTADFSVKGTFCLLDFVYMISEETRQGSEDIELSFFLFKKDGTPLMSYVDSSSRKIYQNLWISNVFKENYQYQDRQQSYLFAYQYIITAIYLNMFKNYAEVEIKNLPPNSKTKDINCKYLNETDFTISFLDSKWFTSLVNSNAFKVRGHFRLQPCGPGMKNRKLIWINDFEKTGYHREATKLKEANVNH